MQKCSANDSPFFLYIVLRGERSRFQLFGDTMNTASRMESTGIKDRIQISQETADELIAAGKVHWLTPREDKVIAKGKGEVETYWLVIDPVVTTNVEEPLSIPALREIDDVERPLASVGRKRYPSNDPTKGSPNNSRDKNARLVDWNVENLLRQLKLICASRRKNILAKLPSFDEAIHKNDSTTVLDEVQEVIRLPRFDAKSVKNLRNSEKIELPVGVEDELRDYVTMIAELYRRNPFHNFEHASHVTMSVNKLLSRIVQPSPDVVVNEEISSGVEKKKSASEMHCFSYGITSDPLTHFACLFSALIHDADHCGVPNSVLIEESPLLSSKYKGKSIAEQNSVDIAWDLLLRDEYKLLRNAIYSTPEEQVRFRQLVVNSGKFQAFDTDCLNYDLRTCH
jgi:3'5'-cyclic nucleotide phosphodiesterase/Adenylate and Guanylate cyclase catalytic domain